jgi:hypothetical protein
MTGGASLLSLPELWVLQLKPALELPVSVERLSLLFYSLGVPLK